jgi:hypothetical protein
MRLRVSHFPQIPCKAFKVEVATLEEGLKLMDMLADYDLFQYESNIKPDYCSTTVLEMWDENSDGEGTPGWNEWSDDEGHTAGDYELKDGNAVLKEYE